MALTISLSHPSPPPTPPPHLPNHKYQFQTILTSLKTCTTLTQFKQLQASILRHNLFFQQQPHLSTFLFNSLLHTLTALSLPNSSFPSYTISLYSHFLTLSLLPNNYTFTFLFKSTSYSLPLTLSLHAHSIVFGLPLSDTHSHTALLHSYSSLGLLATARQLFDQMPCLTAPTCNTMIAAYAKLGNLTTARQLFDHMPDRNEQPWNAFVSQFARIDKYGLAQSLLERMPAKTRPTWNTMIAAYIKDSSPVEALAVFRRMQVVGVRPNAITIVSVLPACAQLGALELGEWVHMYVDKNGLDRNVSVCNALIDMYAKCGHIEKAIAVFKKMGERSVVSWNSMIAGLAIHGWGEQVIELFEEMKNEGVMPDDITFVGLLNACGHCGFVDQAWFYFKQMEDIYSIHPKVEHYGCIMGVLGRSQRLVEAQELMTNLPFEPNSVMLGTLLSACRMCNDFMLGEKVLEKLVDMDPLNPGYYVLLSNIYAASGQRKDVIKIRNLMKSRGVNKIPGCSTIEVDNMVHEFVVGDKSHPLTKEIYTKLDEIFNKLRLAGYVPDTSIVLVDLDEEEKAENLSLHSEKLAVAFGLLKASPGKAIRVVKNLRVCRDCHTAIKLISEIYSREIILRDCNRFHHFKDGQCSCNDYW